MKPSFPAPPRMLIVFVGGKGFRVGRRGELGNVRLFTSSCLPAGVILAGGITRGGCIRRFGPGLVSNVHSETTRQTYGGEWDTHSFVRDRNQEIPTVFLKT